MDLSYNQLKQLLIDSEKMWSERFDRACFIVREMGYEDLGDLIIGIKETTFKVEGTSQVINSRVILQNKIFNFIQKNGQSKVSNISREFDISSDVVGEHLRALMSQNRIEKIRNGRSTFYKTKVFLKAVG